METLFLEHFGEKTAYSSIAGQGVGVFLIGGHKSEGRKGGTYQIFEGACRSLNVPFTGFDWWGYGESSGSYDSGYVHHWADQALDLFDHVVKRPSIIAGSSMGGVIASYVASQRPHLCKGLIGRVAGFGANLTQQVKDRYGAYIVKTTNANEGIGFQPDEKNVHHYNPIDVSCPVRFLLGEKDEIVPWQTGYNLISAMSSQNKQVVLDQYGTHANPTAGEALYYRAWIQEFQK